MFWIGLIIGVVLGTIFHAVFSKWWNKGKATAKEFVSDVKIEAEKAAKKM